MHVVHAGVDRPTVPTRDQSGERRSVFGCHPGFSSNRRARRVAGSVDRDRYRGDQQPEKGYRRDPRQVSRTGLS